MIDTQRLKLIHRDLDHFKNIIQMPEEEQMKMLGLMDRSRFDIEIDRVHRILKMDESTWKSWDLYLLEESKVIGSCGFHNMQLRHKRAELGYGLDAAYRKRGLMSEAISAVVDHGFAQMALNRIEAFIAPDNTDSINLVKKLGFSFEGTLRQHHFHDGETHDSCVYSKLSEEHA